MIEELETRFNNLKESIGLNNKETLDVMVSLANQYSASKKYDMAENLLREALKIDIDLFGEYSRDTIYTLDCLGNLFLEKKDYIESKRYFDKAYEYKLKTYNEEEIIVAKQELTDLYRLFDGDDKNVF